MTLFLMCLLGLSPWGGIHVFVGKFHLFIKISKITKVLFLLLLFCFSFLGKIFYYFFFSSFF